MLVAVVVYFLFILKSPTCMGCGDLDAKSCSDLETKVKQSLDDANYCDIESDCIISEINSCPFGCNSLVNKNADLTKIKEGVDNYNENCIRCVYDCYSVTSDNIKCENHKCSIIVL